MLTLRRSSVKVTDEELNEIFTRLSVDTEPSGFGAALDRFSRGQLIIEKPWTGSVSKDKAKFTLRRARTGIFKAGVSMLEICGRLTFINDERIITIAIRPVWHAVLNLIWVAIFTSLVVLNLFNNAFGWTMFLSILIIQVLFIVIELDRTDKKLIDYLERCRK